MKPSWFSSLGREVYEPALRQLDETWGVRDLKFRAGPGSVSVHWCDPARILPWAEAECMIRYDSAVEVQSKLVKLQSGMVLEAGTAAIVAAGVWTGQLVHVQGLRAQAGVSCRWAATSLRENFICPWAPYRQLVAFQIHPSVVWAGDGTAIKAENWTRERERQSVERCRRGIGSERQPTEICYGLRPYMRGWKPCYLQEHRPGLWIATGGAKNGTLAAGWCAHQIKERLL